MIECIQILFRIDRKRVGDICRKLLLNKLIRKIMEFHEPKLPSKFLD